MTFRTRFAPSPTGPLHLGHAYSALMTHDRARVKNGDFFLRLDDIDQSRARQHWADQIQDDLTWLGIHWDGEIWSQNDRSRHYSDALQYLIEKDLIYPCVCTRRDISVAANAPQEGAPLIGPDGQIYPGTCRNLVFSEPLDQAAYRLNMRKAVERIENKQITFHDDGVVHKRSVDEMVTCIGDVVLARKGMTAAYHLAIVVDDAEQNITDIVRGEDLREATFIHVLLQSLLGFTTPQYHHHSLIRDENGKRLAKRDDARAITKYRAEGYTPLDIRRLVGLID